MNIVRNLKFDEKPNYEEIRSLFRRLYKKKGFAVDYLYDWSGTYNFNGERAKPKIHNMKE